MAKNTIPDILFEVSWEVCNKMGGIHTVVSSKSIDLVKEIGRDSYITIGPDMVSDGNVQGEFVEDRVLLNSWREAAAKEGIRVKVGHWDIPSKPIAILVDFSGYIARKDELLASLWNDYKVDSLSGSWDYIESALFGYAAGRVIEHYMRFNCHKGQKVAAHMHEWQTGSAVLYLKKYQVPVATIFTTHATVVGRSLAGNGVNLYQELPSCNGDEKARWYNVMAKHSLEKASAREADVFTTVSDLTAEECGQLLERRPDVTPNGFDDAMVPQDLKKIRKKSRDIIVKVAEAMCGTKLYKPFIVGTSGRYEFKNKGLDVFLEALGRINASDYNGREILAVLTIPAGHNGPDKEILARLTGKGSKNDKAIVSTHLLAEPESDAIVCKAREVGLTNSAGCKVKLMFVPSYLKGNDGVFNQYYYDLLAAMDFTVFASYYEPWGYTPLESLSCRVPTVTTSLTGFGLWVENHFGEEHPACRVIYRNDTNYNDVVSGIQNTILEIASVSSEQYEALRENAFKVSRTSLWDEQIKYYYKAYTDALKSVKSRLADQNDFFMAAIDRKIDSNRPNWISQIVAHALPERLKYLDIIAKNLWWCFNEEAINLYKYINPELWVNVRRNPIAFLDSLTLDDFIALEKDKKFLKRLDDVARLYEEYMAGKKERKGPAIAYFCMEYGLDTSLQIYSGGLGILAGDYLKEASDMKVNMTAVGLLYRYGYFRQSITQQGEQVSVYEAQDFSKIPATPVRDSEGNWVLISLSLPGRELKARVWRVDVGRTELYLLDTDFEDNLPEDRQITHHLYGGDWENRLKQEMLLGLGGIRLLRTLGIHADLYHCNEGHAAFIGIERIREYVEQNFTFSEAIELVKVSSLFTTHTPVPAGHDAFSEDLIRTYMSHFPSLMKIDWAAFMSLGRSNPADSNEKFSMSYLACSLSQGVNGVSWLHGKVSRDILSYMWPGYLPEELHIGYVTNGVHYPTWCSNLWKPIHAKAFGPEFATHNYDKKCFEGIYNVESKEIWDVRKKLRARLIERINRRLSNPNVSTHYSPQQIVKIKNTLRDDILTIGFARRFATYKRAHLLFRDLDRLDQIVNNEKHPVQFIYAGKAHPADKAGQDLIKRIVEVSKMPQFIGKIVFVPNYDINLAKYMVQGVDIWMNTPTRPLEASGTSGEKAVMNGVMHFSVLDGWWVEGYKEKAGWCLPMERTYDDQNYQDELDAATIYNMFEQDIVPKFYNIDKGTKLPEEWIQIIRNTIAKVACDFTTNRMMTDYIDRYYNPQYERTLALTADDCKLARKIALWKRKMRRGWPNISLVDYTHSSDAVLSMGNPIKLTAKLFVGDLDARDIGVELVLSKLDRKGVHRKEGSLAFTLVESKDGVALYEANFVAHHTGAFEFAVRVFAYNDLLPHRQDFELVKWL